MSSTLHPTTPLCQPLFPFSRHFFQIFSLTEALGPAIRPNRQKNSRNPQVRPRSAPIPIGAHRQTNHPDRLEPAVALADTYVCERSGDFDDFVCHFLNNERSINRSCRFTFTSRTRKRFNYENCKTFCSPRRQRPSCPFTPTSPCRTRSIGERRCRRNFRSGHAQCCQDIPVKQRPRCFGRSELNHGISFRACPIPRLARTWSARSPGDLIATILGERFNFCSRRRRRNFWCRYDCRCFGISNESGTCCHWRC